MNTDGYKAIYAETLRQQHQIIADLLGLQITWIERVCKGGKVEGAFIGEKPWRPLDDDGDAFRLAVKLKLLLDCEACCASQFSNGIGWHGEGGADGPGQDHAECAPLKANRMAIFSAALQLAKCSPELPRDTSASDSHE